MAIISRENEYLVDIYFKNKIQVTALRDLLQEVKPCFEKANEMKEYITLLLKIKLFKLKLVYYYSCSSVLDTRIVLYSYINRPGDTVPSTHPFFGTISNISQLQILIHTENNNSITYKPKAVDLKMTELDIDLNLDHPYVLIDRFIVSVYVNYKSN